MLVELHISEEKTRIRKFRLFKIGRLVLLVGMILAAPVGGDKCSAQTPTRSAVEVQEKVKPTTDAKRSILSPHLRERLEQMKRQLTASGRTAPKDRQMIPRILKQQGGNIPFSSINPDSIPKPDQFVPPGSERPTMRDYLQRKLIAPKAIAQAINAPTDLSDPDNPAYKYSGYGIVNQDATSLGYLNASALPGMKGLGRLGLGGIDGSYFRSVTSGNALFGNFWNQQGINALSRLDGTLQGIFLPFTNTRPNNTTSNQFYGGFSYPNGYNNSFSTYDPFNFGGGSLFRSPTLQQALNWSGSTSLYSPATSFQMNVGGLQSPFYSRGFGTFGFGSTGASPTAGTGLQDVIASNFAALGERQLNIYYNDNALHNLRAESNEVLHAFLYYDPLFVYYNYWLTGVSAQIYTSRPTYQTFANQAALIASYTSPPTSSTTLRQRYIQRQWLHFYYSQLQYECLLYFFFNPQVFSNVDAVGTYLMDVMEWNWTSTEAGNWFNDWRSRFLTAYGQASDFNNFIQDTVQLVNDHPAFKEYMDLNKDIANAVPTLAQSQSVTQLGNQYNTLTANQTVANSFANNHALYRDNVGSLLATTSVDVEAERYFESLNGAVNADDIYQLMALVEYLVFLDLEDFEEQVYLAVDHCYVTRGSACNPYTDPQVISVYLSYDIETILANVGEFFELSNQFWRSFYQGSDYQAIESTAQTRVNNALQPVLSSVQSEQNLLQQRLEGLSAVQSFRNFERSVGQSLRSVPLTRRIGNAATTFTIDQHLTRMLDLANQLRTCTFTLSGATTLPSSGGSGSITVTTQSNCLWAARSTSPWITVSAGSDRRQGNGTLTFTFGANTGPARAGTLVLAGQNFNVTQSCAATTVSAQPASQSVCAGAPVSFTVTASGLGPFSYQWRRNGANIAGATSSTYGIAAANAGHAGSYDVVITGGCGSATSGTATLTINNATGIATPPSSQTVCSGSPVSFAVTANGTGPFSYQWRRNGVNIAGATSAGYSIASVTTGNAGSYDVVIAGACGTATSSAATLTVNAAPSLTAQPGSQTACPGGSVSFAATAGGAPSATVQWQISTDGGVNFTNIAGAASTTLSLTGLTAAQNGNRYRAVFTNTCGSVTTNAAVLTISAAVAISNQPGSQTVCAGAPANFTATASGAGPFSYQWRKNGVNIAGANSSAYSITNAIANDAGNYDVVINGACGSVTSNVAALTVNSAPNASVQPANQTVAAGGSTSFTATASGTPAPSVQWQVSVNNGVNFTNLPGAISPTLTLTGLVATQNGNRYRAVFTNSCGTAASNAAILTVTCPTLAITPTTLSAGTAGFPYNLSLTAGSGTAPYSFLTVAGVLPGGMTLSSAGVLNGTPTSSGAFNFTVQVTDANGCSNTRVYTLTINGACGTFSFTPPTLPNGFAGSGYSQNITAGGGVSPYSFTVTAGALPPGLSLSSGGLLSGTPTAVGTFNFTITATDANNCTGGRAYTVVVGGGGLQFYPLPQPVRLLETRAGFGGCTTPGAAINAGGTFTLPARGACSGIPANAAAVTGNITVVPSGPGFLTLFPSSASQPTVANSNFVAGEITNNVFTVGLGAGDGEFKIFSSAATHVIVDVTGYYAPPGAGGLYFHPLATPVRLLETRSGFNGCIAPGAPLVGTGNPNADPNQDLPVQGRSPVGAPCNSIPATAQVLVGNATSVFPSGGGYLTIYPSGGARPTVASSNYAGGDVINGPFAVKLGADGKFKVYTLATTHLVVDILGYYSEDAVDANGAGLLFNPLPAPVRLLETRPGGPPLTGCTRTNAPIVGAATHTQQARNFCGLPASAQAVVGNVSVVNSAGAGFLTLFPGNLANAPLVATSNYPAPATFGYNRHYFVGLSPADGTFKVLTLFTTDLILDASGYFAP